jgi:L-asparaginase
VSLLVITTGGTIATSADSGGSVTDGQFTTRRPKIRPFLGALSAASAPRVDIVGVYPGGEQRRHARLY